MKATPFGLFFVSTLGAAIVLGALTGAVAVWQHDGMLGFIAGGLFTMPFAYTLGSANSRKKQTS